MTAEKIIESLKFTATEADEQKDLFTPSTFSINAVLSTRQIIAAILLIINATQAQRTSRQKKIVYIVSCLMLLVLRAAQMKRIF